MARPHARLLHFSTLTMGWHITRTGLDLAKTSKSHSQIFDLILKRKEERCKTPVIFILNSGRTTENCHGPLATPLHWHWKTSDAEHVAPDLKQQIREVLFKGIYTKVKVKIDQRQQSAPIQLNRIFSEGQEQFQTCWNFSWSHKTHLNCSSNGIEIIHICICLFSKSAQRIPQEFAGYFAPSVTKRLTQSCTFWPLGYLLFDYYVWS